MTTIQSDLDPRVAAERRPVDESRRAGAEGDERVGEEDDEQAADRRETATITCVVEDLLGRLRAAVPGRDVRAEEDRDERRRDRAEHDPRDDEAPRGSPAVGVASDRSTSARRHPGSRPCSRSSASARRSREQAGRAGHEALPAVVAGLARAERERDRAVRDRQRARRVVARVLRVVRQPARSGRGCRAPARRTCATAGPGA